MKASSSKTKADNFKELSEEERTVKKHRKTGQTLLERLKEDVHK